MLGVNRPPDGLCQLSSRAKRRGELSCAVRWYSGLSSTALYAEQTPRSPLREGITTSWQNQRVRRRISLFLFAASLG
jgi:hypothetical protein